MPDTKKSIRTSTPLFLVGVSTLLLVIWLSLLGWTLRHAESQFINATYSIDGGAPKAFQLPLSIPSEGRIITINFDIVSSWFWKPALRFAADDCILTIYINGVAALPQDMSFPYCSPEFTRFRLQNHLKTSLNHFTVVLEDHGGLAIFRADAASDALMMLLWILGVGGVLLFLWTCSRLLRWHPADTGIAGVVAAGIFLRAAYAGVTSHHMRSHEWDKHVEYVRYMAENFSVPPAAGGWEFHQPPLYYFLTGLWMRAAELVDRPEAAVLRDLQLFSLLLSILTLLTGVAVGFLLFSGAAKRHERLLFSALVAGFPVLVMFSSRITNDVLSQFLSFLFVFFLLRLWQRRQPRDMWAQALVLAVALITKLSAVLLWPVSVLTTLFLRGVGLKKKIAWTMLTTAACVLLAGWLPVLRLAIEADTTRSMVLGNEGMDPAVTVQNTPQSFLTFHPLHILRHPFNSPYGDEERRQFFPEYFFKSAFFGEFGFPESFRTLAFLILSFGMVSLLLSIFGIICSLRIARSDALPLLLILFLHLAAIIGYRFFFPYAPNQDFRFVTVLTIPWFYFSIVGASALPPFARRLSFSVLSAWAVVFGLLFLKIPFSPPF